MTPSNAPVAGEQIIPASVSHFIIFNPSLQLPTRIQTRDDAGEDRDKDLEDDMKEAAQILFYTSREGGKVSRDRMLRQFGLAKGLMGFTDMVLVKPDGDTDKAKDKGKEVRGWWGVHSHKSRMIIWTPEQGFFVYINVTLSHKASGEATHGSQGLSDHMIIDALQRGYEDFCLLHGPLASLDPAASTTSSSLERFWTRFAFHFESIYLSPSNQGDILPTWIGGFPPSPSTAPSTVLALDNILESSQDVSGIGLITRHGPLHLSCPVPSSVVRYLVNALPAHPPAIHVISPATADRSSLGLGFGLGLRRKPVSTTTSVKGEDEDRQSSWTSWVPGLGVGAASGSSTPTPRMRVETETKTSRWPSFGLSSLGVGTVFGTGKETESASTSSAGRSLEDERQAKKGNEDEASASSETASVKKTTTHHYVEQSEVVMPDLAAAVEGDAEVELSWDKKDIWLEVEDAGKYEKRRVSWIIRDDALLFVLFAVGSTAPYSLPSTASTLAVFASLTPTPLPPRGSTDSTRPSTPSQTSLVNSYIFTHANGTTETHELSTLGTNSATTLAELKDRLASDRSLMEIYAKSSTGKVILAKRVGGGELYLQVGRKDASLTDAEQAVRSFRPHSAIAT